MKNEKKCNAPPLILLFARVRKVRVIYEDLWFKKNDLIMLLDKTYKK